MTGSNTLFPRELPGPKDPVEEPFVDRNQRHEARILCAWLFLVNEAMLFGGLFLAIAVYRLLHPEAMAAAAARLQLWVGAGNTVVLLASGLAMALGVIAARGGRPREAIACLLGAAALGLLFLGIKGYEYLQEYREGLVPGAAAEFPLPPQAEMFFNLYFASTALHALHLAAGVLLALLMAGRIAAGSLALPDNATAVEVTGLYWGLVDVVWIFLYPALYPVGP